MTEYGLSSIKSNRCIPQQAETVTLSYCLSPAIVHRFSYVNSYPVITFRMQKYKKNSALSNTPTLTIINPIKSYIFTIKLFPFP